MNSRTTKLVILWNLILTTLLVVSFGANALWAQAAANPPVQVFTADNQEVGGDFSQSSGGTTVDSAQEVQLAHVAVNLTSNSTCLVTASADVNAAGHGSTHNIGLNMDVTSSDRLSSDREIYFTGSDDREVTSVFGFNNITGAHTFYLLAYGTPSMTVKSRSMVVACFTTRV